MFPDKVGRAELTEHASWRGQNADTLMLAQLNRPQVGLQMAHHCHEPEKLTSQDRDLQS
jgi:hypothetical protein